MALVKFFMPEGLAIRSLASKAKLAIAPKLPFGSESVRHLNQGVKNVGPDRSDAGNLLKFFNLRVLIS